MSGTLLSTLTPNHPVNAERWPGGQLYFANGLDSVYKWNGYRATAVTVGVETPSQNTPTIAGSGSGGITGDYQIYQRFIDEDGNASLLGGASAITTVTANDTLTFANLVAPLNARTVKRQILRNTAGEYSVFYVDKETTDLSSTSFTSTNTDDQLGALTPVPLFDTDGNSLTSIWTAPRDDKPIIVPHKGRMWAAGEAAYTLGSVSVTNGAATVQGYGTNWSANMAGRELWITGETTTYTISSLNTTTQVLTLSGNYTGTTNLFAVYAIRPAVAQRNTVYFSQPGEPEQWPSTNGVTIEATSDAITAMIPSPAYLFVSTEKAVYQFSFDSNPITDGSAYLAANRGCVNQRTWIKVLDMVFVLDAAGVYILSGTQTEEVAGDILDLWNAESDGEYKIAWESKGKFHAVHDREDSTVRFFVCLGGPGYPRHALAYHYVLQQWTIEEYPFAVGCSTAWQAIRHRVLCGGLGPRLLELGVGAVDGLNPAGYRSTGSIAASTPTSVTDSYLLLPASGVAGSPVAITAGRGKGQLRIIDSVSGTRINVTQPWTILPDTTSQYQVGGIQWRTKTGWFRYPKEFRERSIEVAYKPLGTLVGIVPNQTWSVGSGYMDVRVYYDHSTAPALCKSDKLYSEDGVSYAKNDPNIVVNLTRDVGYAQFVLVENDAPSNRQGSYVALEFRGTSSQYGVFLYEVRWGAATR